MNSLPQAHRVQRRIVGIVAALLLVAAVAITVLPSGHGYAHYEGFCWRSGSLLGIWWLAYPDLARLPAWVLVGVPVLIVILARSPRSFLFFIPVVIVLTILKPRWGGRR